MTEWTTWCYRMDIWKGGVASTLFKCYRPRTQLLTSDTHVVMWGVARRHYTQDSFCAHVPAAKVTIYLENASKQTALVSPVAVHVVSLLVHSTGMFIFWMTHWHVNCCVALRMPSCSSAHTLLFKKWCFHHYTNTCVSRKARYACNPHHPRPPPIRKNMYACEPWFSETQVLGRRARKTACEVLEALFYRK